MTDVVPVTRKESLKYEIFEILYMQNVISANPGIPAIVVMANISPINIRYISPFLTPIARYTPTSFTRDRNDALIIRYISMKKEKTVY